MCATYFLNLHSEFYNLFEKTQVSIVEEIIALGHDVGLHFDATFKTIHSEDELGRQITVEGDVLEQLFGIRPQVFSFHNPVAAHLACEADSYGGMVNCYSRRFKTEVAYCSDSNGYWRFRRLYDVLQKAEDECLQVLIHPDWWQDEPMPARQRIFRCVYGRASASMRLYDHSLANAGRENLAGEAANLRFLRQISPAMFSMGDYLWQTGTFETLFVELWRCHEGQVTRLCKATLFKDWRVPAREINVFFDGLGSEVNARRLYAVTFGKNWPDATGVDQGAYEEWFRLWRELICGRSVVAKDELERGCVYLCGAIHSLAVWGLAQPIAYDGLAGLETIGIPTCRLADGTRTDRFDEPAPEMQGFEPERWETFKSQIVVCAGAMS